MREHKSLPIRTRGGQIQKIRWESKSEEIYASSKN